MSSVVSSASHCCIAPAVASVCACAITSESLEDAESRSNFAAVRFPWFTWFCPAVRAVVTLSIFPFTLATAPAVAAPCVTQ